MEQYAELWAEKALATKLWRSAKAQKGFRKHADNQFMAKLERWLKNGLDTYIGNGNTFPVSSQGQSVFRIADRSSLFRIIGFFEGNNVKGAFVAPIADQKSGMKTPQEWIDEAARVRDQKDWSK